MKIYQYIQILFVCLTLSACATPTTMSPQGSKAEIQAEVRKQEKIAYESRVTKIYKNIRRLDQISFPILKRNKDLCGDQVAYDFGIRVWQAQNLNKKYRNTAAGLYGLDDHVNVYMTVGRSPADLAGINRGDKIISVNDHVITPGSLATNNFRKIIKQATGEKVKFVTERKGVEKTTYVKPVEVCDYPIQYVSEDGRINAFADGKRIYVTEGIVSFLPKNDQLAVIVSHELAHNVMGHSDKQSQNALAGGLFGLLLDVAIISQGGVSINATQDLMSAGAQAYSVAFEQEADYVGMYILARSGYPLENAEMLWRKMALEVDPSGIALRRTHPTHAERFVALQKAREEVYKKKKKGQKLLPTMDPKKKNIQKRAPKLQND